MKDYTGFISLFYPALPNFWQAKTKIQDPNYGSLFDIEIWQEGETVKFKTTFNEDETIHEFTLDKSTPPFFTGNCQVEGEGIGTLMLSHYTNSTGHSFYGTYEERAFEYSCLIILTSKN